MKNLKKFIPQLCYVAASVNFIASTIASITRKPSGTLLSIGALFLCLGVMYSERAKKNQENEEKQENKDNEDNK